MESNNKRFSLEKLNGRPLRLLIGGSPCTYWSISQSPSKREVINKGIGWELFLNYVIAKKKFNPDFFLYENNESVSKIIQNEIEKSLGVDLYILIQQYYRLKHVTEFMEQI